FSEIVDTTEGPRDELGRIALRTETNGAPTITYGACSKRKGLGRMERVVPTSALGVDGARSSDKRPWCVDARAPDHELLPRWSGSSGVIAARRSPGLTVQDPVRIPARALGYPADTRQPGRQGISVRVEQLCLGRLTEPPADHLALEAGRVAAPGRALGGRRARQAS